MWHGLAWCKHQNMVIGILDLSAIKRKVSWVVPVSGLVVGACNNIMDGWDGYRDVTHHHVLLCFLYRRQAQAQQYGGKV